jgi:hypothetical protein
MLIYLSVLGVALILPLFININENEKAKKRYLVFVFSLVALVSALRGITVGTDTRQFCNAYIEIGHLSWDRVFALRYEPGFIFLCKLLNYISDSYQLLLIVSSCFISFSFARFIYKNSDDAMVSAVVFFCMFYAFTLSAMRQSIAVCFLLFGLEFLKEKKHHKFLIFVLLAASFHYSAVVCVVFIILYKFIITYKVLLPLTVVFVIIYLNYESLVSIFLRADVFGMYANYIGSVFDVQDTVTRPLKILMALSILFFLSVTVKDKIKQEGIKYSFIVNMLLVWAAIEAFAMNMLILSRFIPYFDFITLLAVPKSLKNIEGKLPRGVFTLSVSVLMFAYFYITRINKNDIGLLPYRFFWEV